MTYVIDLSKVNLSHIAKEGGKNASTGEMIQNLFRMGIKSPGGFAVTTDAYKAFLAQNQLDKKIHILLSSLKSNDIKALHKASRQIQRWIISTPFLPEFEMEIGKAYQTLGTPAVAVRSS